MKNFKKHIWIGLSWSLLLFALSFILFFNFSYMGVRDQSVEKIITANFKTIIVLFNLKILFIYGVVALIVSLFSLLLRIERRGNIFLFHFFIWFWFLLRAVKISPQLFVDPLYLKGGILQNLQIFITDLLPLWVIYAIMPMVVLAAAWRKKRLPHGLAVIVLVALFIFPFKTTAVKAQKAGARPNILILGSDSLRPDHLSYNGYFRPTPNIDRLLARGANFLNAKSSLARTFSSFTSVFTSTFPPDHRIRHMFPRPEELQLRMPTLIQALKKQGYDTGMISDFAGDIFARLGYGFDHIQAPHLTLPNLIKQRSLEFHYFLLSFLINPIGRDVFPVMWLMPLNIDPFYVTNTSKRFIRNTVKAGKPFFMVYFSSNSHFPYGSQYPYYQMYTKRSYRGPHKFRKVDMMKTYSGFDQSPENKEQIVALYDGAVRMFDDQVGEMLGFLKKSGLDRDTIIVLFSDHGESLYENGYGTGHGDHLRGPYSNNMVFGLYSPYEDFGGRRIVPTVRDIDIAPTLLDLVKINPPASFKGHSLLPVMRGGEFAGYPAYMETELWYTPETPYIKNRVRMAYPGIMKVIELEPQTGEIILKKEFNDVVIQGKYRGVQLNNRKYIYMPDEQGFQEEWFMDEKPVAREAIQDDELLNLKYKLLELFKDKFIILRSGRIKERIE
ncbi:MAG: sulfatase [Acidobacteria bacterium]|nr:sulfatase [Acidobacteriota bacterium]MBU4307659.1 sulfatase [Acidobacteriota bacterium]MCG2809843.1 sulfatase [Candidatus Aminicenantes bacterium]